MVISDLQYLESVEASTLVGGSKYKPRKRPSYGLVKKIDVDIDQGNYVFIKKVSKGATVTINQSNTATVFV